MGFAFTPLCCVDWRYILRPVRVQRVTARCGWWEPDWSPSSRRCSRNSVRRALDEAFSDFDCSVWCGPGWQLTCITCCGKVCNPDGSDVVRTAKKAQHWP